MWGAVKKIRGVLEGPETDTILQKHIDALFLKPEGMMLAMAGLNNQTLKPLVKPFVVSPIHRL